MEKNKSRNIDNEHAFVFQERGNMSSLIFMTFFLATIGQSFSADTRKPISYIIHV